MHINTHSPLYLCSTNWGWQINFHLGQVLSEKYVDILVPDSKSRNIPEVVVVRRRAGGVLGIWEGWVNWWRVGQTGSVYKQPEREVDDSCHNWRGQVSRGGCKGNTKGYKGTKARGRKANGNAPCIYVIVCTCNGVIECWFEWHYLSCI